MLKIRRMVSCLCLTGILMVAFFNTGTVRKKTSALLKTQAAPIKLKDKLEEIKDGEKGPATPVFAWYGGGNKFMIAAPFDTTKPQPVPAELPNKISEVDVGEKKAEALQEKDSDWGAESDNKAPESLPAKADKEEAAAGALKQKSQDSVNKAPAVKEEKDWWDAI